MPTNPWFALTAVSLTLLAASCQPASPPAQAHVAELAPSQYRPIVLAALGASRQFDDTSGTGVIPPSLWQDAITELKPLRVREEIDPDTHVFIVLRDDAEAEEGLLVYHSDSTPAPQAQGMELHLLYTDPDQAGSLYRYRVDRTAPLN